MDSESISSVQVSVVGASYGLQKLWRLTTPDDTLRRLAPSLKDYHHCDIVDINPGACLWSSKLHNLIRPRRHLLVEPDKDLYHRYLDPLLKATGSHYHHVPLDTRDYLFFDKIFGQDFLPEQNKQEPTNYSIPRVNRTLLVTVNVTPRERDLFGETNFVAQSTHMSYAFLRSYLTRSVFNKYGLVRVLMWAPDFQAERFLPKSVSNRTKESLVAELATKVDMITCSQSSLDDDPRDYRLYLQNQNFVKAKMVEEQTLVPNSRLSKMKEPGFLDFKADESEIPLALKNLTHKSDWIQKWLDLEDGLVRGDFSMKREKSPTGKSKLCDKTKQLVLLRRKFGELSKERNDIMRLLDRRLPLEDGKNLDSDELNKEAEAVDRDIQRLPRRRTNEAKLRTLLDDYRMFRDRHAGLQWSRRHAEPLTNMPDEFYPQESLSLVDFQPTPSILQKIDNQEKLASVLFIFDRLFADRATSLPVALENLAPDGLTYLLAEVPALEDWARSFRTSIADVRTRAIPTNLLLDLALAWHRWPFRPPMDVIQRGLPLNEQAYFAAS